MATHNRRAELFWLFVLCCLTLVLITLGFCAAIAMINSGGFGRIAVLSLIFPVAGGAVTVPLWQRFRGRFGYDPNHQALDENKDL